jgi:hypothetical protein
MFRWHITKSEYVEFTDDVTYENANDAQKDKLNEFIIQLEMRGYQDAEKIVKTSKMKILRDLGLNANPDPDETEKFITANGHYKCCGYYLNHPGCYVGPQKYKMTPWVLVPNIEDIWSDPEKIWNQTPIPGAYHLFDPTDQIISLKKNLAPKVVKAIQKGSIDPENDLGIEYFMLKKYGEIEFPPAPGAAPQSPKPPNVVAVPPVDPKLDSEFYRRNPNIVLDAPFGNDRLGNNRYSTLNYFKWENNSCWLDAPLTCLFSIAGSEWENQLRNARYYDGVTRALMEDIIYLQTPNKGPKEPARSLRYFADHFREKQKVGDYDDARTTVENMVNAFDLDIEMPLQYNSNVFSFVGVLYNGDVPKSRDESHFVSYVKQPDNFWIRIDARDQFEPIKFIKDIKPYIIGHVDTFKYSYTDPNGLEVVENRNRYEMPYVFFSKVLKPINLTKLDVLKHWENVRSYFGLVQPVYLSLKRQKDRVGVKKIPLHNVKLYETESPENILKDIGSGKFDYPDSYVERGYDVLINDTIPVEKLKVLISIFLNEVVEITDKQLIKYIIIPEYEATIVKGKIMKSNIKTDFDTSEMLPLFEVKKNIMGNKVFNI